VRISESTLELVQQGLSALTENPAVADNIFDQAVEEIFEYLKDTLS